MLRLTRDFYLQPTLIVAQKLIGKYLVLEKNGRTLIGEISETEAYLADDPASHTFRGPNLRNKSMFLNGGHTYVYLVYGRHFCLNLVTQGVGVGEGVLIRSLQPVKNLGFQPIIGPGRICRALDINLKEDGIDSVTSNSIWVGDVRKEIRVEALPRIGITKAQEKLWRFIAAT